ncbi:MAG: transposase [Bacteroidales bacterium]|nr:transposase [Candidatus Scybalousia scybalohippi]
MTKNIALKVRLYPTSEQIILINKTLGCCRQIYNTMLASRLKFYDENIKDKELSKSEKSELYKSYKSPTEKELKTKFGYLKEVSSVALQQSRRDQETAFAKFFKGLSKFPKSHSKKQKNSYREINVNDNCRFDWNHRRIKLPKIGEIKFKNRSLPKWLNLKEYKLCNITVSKNPCNQYYASILFEVEKVEVRKHFDNENQVIGLDFSPAEMYVDSLGSNGIANGYKPQKQNHLKQLKKLERRYASTKKDSRNREKARIKLARLEKHIADSRKDWIEKETLRLLRNYQAIGVEDLTIKGLMRACKNARNYVDTSWSGFVQRMIDKSERFNSQVVKADRFFASSKLCSVCGWKFKNLTLNIRKWTCSECGTNHIRDVNAAINLKNNAKNVLLEEQDIKSVEFVESEADCQLVLAGAFDETERDAS